MFGGRYKAVAVDAADGDYQRTTLNSEACDMELVQSGLDIQALTEEGILALLRGEKRKVLVALEQHAMPIHSRIS